MPTKQGSAPFGSSSSLRLQKPSEAAGPKPFSAGTGAGAEQKVGRPFLKKSTPTYYPGIKPKQKEGAGSGQKGQAQPSYANSSGQLSRTLGKAKTSVASASGSLNASLTKPKDALNASQSKRKSALNQSLGKSRLSQAGAGAGPRGHESEEQQ